jgi:flagellar basal-body rod modification protein FlgD
MPSTPVGGTAPPPVSALTGQNTATTTSSTSGPNSLGPDSFLKLLTTELQNQDPTQPSDPTQSVTQLAQFSQLQYQQQLANAFTAFQGNFGVMQAATLIGKSATVNVGSSGAGGNSATVTGTINSITVQNGQPYFTMTDSNGKVYTDSNGNPLLFATSSITGLGAGMTGGTGTGPGTGTGVGTAPTSNSPVAPGTGVTPGG